MNHEARALSALLVNRDIMSALSQNMAPLMKSFKTEWDFVYRYYQNNKDIPPLSVFVEQFPNFPLAEELEGSTTYYIQVLRHERVHYEVSAVLKGAYESLKDGEGSAVEISTYAMKRMAEIQRNNGLSRSVDVRDVESAGTELDRRRELAEMHGGQIGIPSGFEHIDAAYPTGFAPGHFDVFLGYSGLGKTWFVIKLAINAWLAGYKPLIINLEMSPEELRDRIFHLISDYNMDDLIKAQIDPKEFRTWAHDFMTGKVPFYLVGNDGFGSFTTDMVAGKIEQYKPDIVYLDYLQLFTDRAMSTNDVTRAKATARELKELAMASNLPIVVVSAVTGKDKKDRLVAPSLAQVAWSSEIEYAANMAVAIHTHRDPTTQKAGDTQVVGLKNRHGELFSFSVRMDLNAGTITEIEEDDQFDWMDQEDPKVKELMNVDLSKL